jgi:hypothetical protein
MHARYYRTLVVATFLLLLALPAFTLTAGASSEPSASASAAAGHTRASVVTHPSQGPSTVVNGASAHLVSTNNGITVVMSTKQLVEKNPHTLWVVVINRPDLCLTSPCTSTDILTRTDIVKANVVYGSGFQPRKLGLAVFAAHLPTGPVAGGWYENDFTNPRGAEVHLVINDHGPAIPGMVNEMLSTYRAGCTDESIPVLFPATARADGTPGPNQCRLVQMAILQQ